MKINYKIFLSHSSDDKVIIGHFTSFLESSMKIFKEEIYCSSINNPIPVGQQFTPHIREHIKDVDLVIFFITPNFIRSYFCLCEMGASWAFNSKIYPIIVPPLNRDILESTPLKGIHAVRLDSKASIETIYKNLIDKKIGIQRDVSIFNKEAEELLFNLNKYNSSAIYSHLNFKKLLIELYGKETKFGQHLLTNDYLKYCLGDMVYELLQANLLLFDSIYFSVGTTVYEIHNCIIHKSKLLLSYLKVYTSNFPILLESIRAGFDNYSVVGEYFCREYSSFYFLDANNKNSVICSVAIISISGISISNGGDIKLRICWQEQVITVKEMTLRTKKMIIIACDYNKLLTSDGSDFISIKDIEEDINLNNKKYYFIINTNNISPEEEEIFNSKIQYILKSTNFKLERSPETFTVLKYEKSG